MATLGLLVPGWLTLDGLLDTSRIFIESGLLALGMTFVIITGGIDLSVASLLALVSVVIGFSHQVGLPLPGLRWLLGVATGVGCGLLNGAVVAYLGLHPLVVTLATMALFRGAAYVISNAELPIRPTRTGSPTIGGYYIGGIVPAQLPVFALVLCMVAWIVLAKTPFGRRVYGLGENEQAVRFSGANVAHLKLKIYGLMGFLAVARRHHPDVPHFDVAGQHGARARTAGHRRRGARRHTAVTGGYGYHHGHAARTSHSVVPPGRPPIRGHQQRLGSRHHRCAAHPRGSGQRERRATVAADRPRHKKARTLEETHD